MKRMKYTTNGELAQKLVEHLTRIGVDADVAYRRVAIYYGLGGARGTVHP